MEPIKITPQQINEAVERFNKTPQSFSRKNVEPLPDLKPSNHPTPPTKNNAIKTAQNKFIKLIVNKLLEICILSAATIAATIWLVKYHWLH